ncbi:NADH-ubiquinone oxidoreductase chain 5-like, partial [Halictus rubicundus]|uniref:NADH-ubiquinone oxidoreductase chain 5-like n=1 Tax=Halictus rubicundus TaxID=77578 RepID=UPI00403609B9
LPAAITAPTPISSLVHSSTLVTAGIYLIIRYNKFILIEVKRYIIIISSLTMFMAGLIANYEYNLKKVIALSTLRQLGFIIRILGLGIVNLGFYHLLIHAFFKSLIFICVGGYIHTSLGRQDLRKFKGVIRITPLKSVVFIFSFMNLSGFPFISGFYSKDLILEFIIVRRLNKLIIYILMISTVLTINYRVRIIKLFFEIYLGIYRYQYVGDGKFIIFCKFFIILLVIFFGYFYLRLINYFICIITENDKLVLIIIYILR